VGKSTKRTAALFLVAGVCYLLSALHFIYLHGFSGFGHGFSAVGPVADLLAGTLFLIRAAIDFQKSALSSMCRPSSMCPPSMCK
jgi:hypothetical protein